MKEKGKKQPEFKLKRGILRKNTAALLEKMEYTNIKSKYVKEKIKITNWKNRDYIDNLLRLEGWIIKAPGDFGSNMYFRLLKSQYEEEYMNILKELNPKQFKVFLADLKSKEKEHQKMKSQFEKELSDEKKEWIKAGGKP